MLGWELPPHNSGGLGVACYQLCKALSEQVTSIDFLVPYQADHGIDFMNVVGAMPYKVGANETFFPGGVYDSGEYRLENSELARFQNAFTEASVQIVKDGDYDIIHAHDWLTLQAGTAAQEHTGKPLVAHMHSVESDRSGAHFGGNTLVREIESIGLHRADAIIAVSDHTKRAIMREYDIPEDKITVIHNSVDHSSFAHEESLEDETSYQYLKLMKEQGWRIVVYIGRLTIQKGLSYLLEAAADAVRFAPKTLFVFVGGGEQRDELIMQAAAYGLTDKIFFTGFQRGKRWRDAYKIADLFVMPSVSEPFGLVALEAIGYGAPVLISKQSGVSEVMQNVLKVDFWDTKKLTEYLVGVAQNPSLQQELKDNARRELNNMSWHRQIPHFIDLYHKAKLAGATT